MIYMSHNIDGIHDSVGRIVESLEELEEEEKTPEKKKVKE